jgi:allophanate hydrolase subunit 2
MQKQQFEEYVKQQEIALSQQELQIKQSAVQVDMLKVQATSESDANKQAITQETNRMGQMLELQKLELEQMRIKVSETEKLMEERRLSSDNELERIRLSMDAIQRMPQQAPILLQTDKPMIIEKAAPAPRRKRKGKIISDIEGNPIGIELEDEE